MTASMLILLAAAGLAPATAGEVDRQVHEIFRPYRENADDRPVWERPIFSRELRTLIAHWQRVAPEGEVDDLNDADWLCQCQDWDPKAFDLAILKVAGAGADRASVDVRIGLGAGEAGKRRAQLRLEREQGGWMIGDLYAAESFPEGLKQALRETIAKDEALRREKRP
ncbi:YbjP/YqhG family protein [Novosphingobium sp. JCM 18896]|uniref:YbjP/YqhG family protein n=1 Tax=Novosphingobium sp. JCM 18896 TaxID=2989731 RepID=UPI0022214E55|nr:YbjP/YqhG family protein [Novosphingobium sp. JCM 18896]MCW1427958.1 YbjP/YqhG family protein [Novosphingobium sp. JCM 18896]